MKKAIIIISAFCYGTIASAQIKNSKTDTLFFDDFNSQSLNRNKWNVEITGNTANNEQQAYVDSSATIYFVHGKLAEGAKNGALVIKPLYRSGFTTKERKSYDFISGRINTRSKFEFTHGTASARMKITAGAGLWPAFWLLGNGEWPACGEIDIMETVGDSSWISNALHGPGYFGNTPLVRRDTFPKGTDVAQWHIYSVDWTSKAIIFKVDGKAAYTVTRSMVEKYGRWAFDNPKFIILNFAIGGGYPNAINKITSPYFGLSQKSADLIKARQAKILVDWVLVVN